MPDEYRDAVFEAFRQVREDIKDLKRDIREVKDGAITDMKVDIAMLQVKAGVWGLIGGCIPVAIYVILSAIKK